MKKIITGFTFLIISLAFIQVAFAQQPSVIWDEATKSWISGPATAPAPAQTNPTAQTQIPQTTTTTPQIIQTVPTTPGNSTVDLGTLMTVITPMLAAISGIFIKNRKDMENKDKELKAEVEKKAEEVRKQTIDEIKAAIVPQLKQIMPVTEQTAKQDVKINQLAEALYEFMGDKTNEIHDKPEIKKQNLIEDVVKSKIIAEQAKNGSGSIVWDDKKKEWVSK